MKNFDMTYSFDPFMELRGSHVTDSRLFWEIGSEDTLWSKIKRFFLSK